MRRRLIYDLGINTGQDTGFYLKKGFAVVGVEADPELARRCAVRFAVDIAQHRLIVIDKAVSASRGVVRFFRNLSHVEWGTIKPAFAARNATRYGAPSVEIEVQSIRLIDILRTHGTPYYLKIDLEGADDEVVADLSEVNDRPKFVSVEASKSLKGFLRQVELLARLGYERFAIVSQRAVPRQRAPVPPREGALVDHRFEFGASGLFGEEIAARWRRPEAAVRAYRRIALLQDLIGDYPRMRSHRLCDTLHAIGLDPGWHDLHARRR